MAGVVERALKVPKYRVERREVTHSLSSLCTVGWGLNLNWTVAACAFS